jgi:hypothetical protein
VIDRRADDQAAPSVNVDRPAERQQFHGIQTLVMVAAIHGRSEHAARGRTKYRVRGATAR